MIVTQQDLPKRRVALTIEVSEDEACPLIERVAKKISEDVKIPGFRPGHVPMDVLKKHVGEASIYQEAFQSIVEKTYVQAIEQQKLPIVGRASIDVQKLAPGNPIIYVATVSLFPEVKLGKLEKLKARKKKVEVDAKELEKTLNELRKMRATEVLVNRAAAQGDKVLVDFTVKVDGVVIEGGKAEKMPLVLGEGRFIPGFEDHMMGLAKGAQKQFTLPFPDNYFKKELSGKTGEFSTTLQEVYEVKSPELNDELAKELQFKDVADLKSAIEKNIATELEKKETDRFEAELLNELAEKSKFSDLPDDLIDDETDKMLEELRGEIERENGLKFDDYLAHIKKTEEDLKKDFHERAEQRLKVALVARSVADQEKITVSEADVDAELKKLREQFSQVPDFSAQMENPGYRRYLSNMMAHRKVVEKLASYAKD